jgi:hypothetical protein
MSTHQVHSFPPWPLFPRVLQNMAAIHSSSQILFCLLLPIVMAMAGPLDYDLNNPCQCPTENETNLHLYLHQFPAWANVTNPNEAPITVGGPPIGFGTTYVDDWILTEGPSPYEKIIGRAQGFHLQAGQSRTSWYTSHIFVFQDGR